MIIDSHQHFWIYEPEKHAWINDEMAVIRQDFTPALLQKVYEDNAIDGCVAVQADQTLAENDFLLDLASKNSFIKGIVGWVDLQSRAVDKELEAYSSLHKIKGFRHIVQGEPDPDFLLRPQFLRGISKLEAYGYVYDILIFPHQLATAAAFIKRFPNQQFVIDHMAKPTIKDGLFDHWAVLMSEIAKHENVHCKISGMITEADYDNWTPQQIEPYMQLVLHAFGSSRVMFGSDWPVCLVAGNYSQVKNLTTNFIATLSIDEQKAIMGNNAISFYNL